MNLPQSNAILRKVASGGAPADYDQPAGDDATDFEGAAGAYYREKRERITTGEGSDVIVRRELIVHTRNPGITYKQGATVTFEVEGETQTGEIQEVVTRRLPGAGPAESTVLTLEAA